MKIITLSFLILSVSTPIFSQYSDYNEKSAPQRIIPLEAPLKVPPLRTELTAFGNRIVKEHHKTLSKEEVQEKLQIFPEALALYTSGYTKQKLGKGLGYPLIIGTGIGMAVSMSIFVLEQEDPLPFILWSTAFVSSVTFSFTIRSRGDDNVQEAIGLYNREYFKRNQVSWSLRLSPVSAHIVMGF